MRTVSSIVFFSSQSWKTCMIFVPLFSRASKIVPLITFMIYLLKYHLTFSILCHWKPVLQSNLAQVIGVHAKHKPFQCISCSSSFSFKDGLEQHINMVHKDIRPFPCSHCLAQFKSKSSLHKHLLRSHARFGEKQEKWNVMHESYISRVVNTTKRR